MVLPFAYTSNIIVARDANVVDEGKLAVIVYFLDAYDHNELFYKNSKIQYFTRCKARRLPQAAFVCRRHLIGCYSYVL